MIISFLEKTKTFSEIYRTQTNLKNHEKHIYLKFYHQQEFTGYPVGLRHYLWLLPGKITWKKCCNFQRYKSLRLESSCAVTRVSKWSHYLQIFIPSHDNWEQCLSNRVVVRIKTIYHLFYWFNEHLRSTVCIMANSWIQNNMVDKKRKKLPPSSDLNSGGKDGH